MRPSWSRLGAILGHFRSPLGVKNIDFSLVFIRFREKSRFSKNIASIAILDRTWLDFGASGGRLGLIFGGMLAPKIDQKIDPKNDRNFDAKKASR